MKYLKPILFIISIILTSAFAKGQEKVNTVVLSAPMVPITKADSDKVFAAVEQSPDFPGGMNKFYLYITTNVRYPENARKKNIQGKVFVTFIVERDGSLSNVRVARGVSEDIDAEAVRVIQASPKWNPGLQNGVPVRVVFTMPLSFILNAK